MNKVLKSHIALFLVTTLWGMTFPLIRDAVSSISPALFVVFRVGISFLVFAPFIIIFRKKTSIFMLLGALLLGLTQSATYVFQSIGLETTGSAVSAFITAFGVVVVPFLALILLRNKPRWYDFVAALLCLLGIFILTGANLSHVTAGDLWTLACAVSYALYIVLLQYFTKRLGQGITLIFLGYQSLFSLLLPSLYMRLRPVVFHFTWFSLWAVLFCSLGATCLVFFLQFRYQRYVSASKAALIYAFEPVFATIFGYVFNKESITRSVIIGGLVIIFAFLISEFASYLKTQPAKR